MDRRCAGSRASRPDRAYLHSGLGSASSRVITTGVATSEWSSTETVFEPEFVTAKSGWPSLFKSPIAVDVGAIPVPKSSLLMRSSASVGGAALT